MTAATWLLLIGALLILMALSGTLLKALPVSAAALYLAIGFAVGPGGFGLIDLDLQQNDRLIEHISEAAVLVSLFAVGLRLQIRTQLSSWVLPALLASVGMVITVFLMTAAGLALQWSLPGALLLAAILAPTDPVLASDVQVRHENDADELRFALTAEGGLNDGAAFPLVLLALGLLHANFAEAAGWRWLGIDVAWAVLGGLALGWTSGALFTRLTLFLQTRKQQALGMESFLALGLIALTYGVALHGAVYGFIAVFVAGLSMRNVERKAVAEAEDAKSGHAEAEADPAVTAEAETANAMTRDVLGFAKEMEKFVELIAMLVIGCLLRPGMFTLRHLLLAFLLLAVVRPVAVYLTTRGSRWSPSQRRLGAWFGIRGVGSIYYLAYASAHGARGPDLDPTIGVVMVTVTVSVLLHGASATPLMRLYRSARKREPQG